MNSLSLSILTLLHYNVIVRDGLEYCLDRGQYKIEAFDYKKNGLMIEIKEKTPLKSFMEQNKEIGKKIEDEINALYAALYADDSTICKKANNELRVDQSQHLAIYDTLLPLHEDVKRVIDSHLRFARENNMLEDKTMQLVAADERMYRTVSFLCLYRDLSRLFAEYNKARSEAKGAVTPQSNFVQGEILKVVKHIQFVKDNASCTDVDYWDIVDAITRTVDQTSGRRRLPEGKRFQQVFDETLKMITDYLAKVEDAWKKLYEPAIAELAEAGKKNNGQLKIDVQADKKAAEEAAKKATEAKKN